MKLVLELNESCPQMLHDFLCFKLKVCLDLSLFLRIFLPQSFIVSSFLQNDKLANTLH